MLKTIRGFTLIELLITVAIIGILASLFIPNALSAIHKSKQKSTMKNIMKISTAIADYVTDNGVAPTQSGTYDATTSFFDSLSPFYIQPFPLTDEWGAPFRAWCGSGADQYGISGSLTDDFLVSSFGRDKGQESFSFDPASPEDGLFYISSMSDFDRDLVMWNGSWIRYPRVGHVGS